MRILRAEKNAHAFRTYQFNNGFYLLQQCGAGFLENQMGFIDKQYQFWFIKIAFFR